MFHTNRVSILLSVIVIAAFSGSAVRAEEAASEAPAEQPKETAKEIWSCTALCGGTNNDHENKKSQFRAVPLIAMGKSRQEAMLKLGSRCKGTLALAGFDLQIDLTGKLNREVTLSVGISEQKSNGISCDAIEL